MPYRKPTRHLPSLGTMYSGPDPAVTRARTMPLSGGLPTYSVYHYSDGKYVALGTLESKFWQNFCRLLGKPDWLDFGPPSNLVQTVKYKRQIQAVFLEKNCYEWTRFERKNDILITPVNTLADLETDPHLVARQTVVTQKHLVAGPFRIISVRLKFSATPTRSLPSLWEDAQDVQG